METKHYTVLLNRYVKYREKAPNYVIIPIKGQTKEIQRNIIIGFRTENLQRGEPKWIIELFGLGEIEVTKECFTDIAEKWYRDLV